MSKPQEGLKLRVAPMLSNLVVALEGGIPEQVIVARKGGTCFEGSLRFMRSTHGIVPHDVVVDCVR